MVHYRLLLLCAVAHALWNAMVKGSYDRLLMLASIRAVGLFMGCCLVFFVPIPNAASWPYLIAATITHYVYYTFMLAGYRVGDFSQVYPIARGVAPLVVACLGAFMIGERLDADQLLAVSLVSVGIISLALSPGAINALAVLFAFGTGLTIAGYTFLSGIGVRQAGTVLGYAAWLEIMTGTGEVLTASIRRRSSIGAFLESKWKQGVTAGVLSVGAYIIVLWAMVHLPLASVAALRETSVIFAALIGALAFREPFGLRRVVASCCVAVGIVILAFSAQ